MTDLDLDSKAILNGLVYLDQHKQLPASGATAGLVAPATVSESARQRASPSAAGSSSIGATTAIATAAASVATYQGQSVTASGGMSPKTAARHFSSAGPHAIASLKVETSAVLKELARFRACDDQTMSCFYCREWAQWVYRKQISPQAAAAAAAAASGGGAGASAGNAGRKKKSKTTGAPSLAAGAAVQQAQAATTAEDAVTSAAERKRAVRQRYSTVADLCESLRGMVADERRMLAADDGDVTGSSSSRPGSPAPAPALSDERSEALGSSTLINDITERVTLWYEGHQFPLADVYEDLTFDFPADAFPYDDHQDPLDPALLLPALQVTKAFVGLPAADFALLGNITSELIATHTYPTCQHTKADHPTPAELETQRLIFNAQLSKWRGDYRRSFEREMEPVWQITHLLLKSAQRIDAMRVRLFARGCRANRQQFLQTIRTRTMPFAEYWPSATAALQSPQPPVIDALVAEHLDNLLEVSATWSRTFLESYYGVAREFARELETILGECITMCDRRAQGLKYPPPLTLQPQLDAARAAIACLLPRLDARIQRIQRVVVERNTEIRTGTDEVRRLWAETSGATTQSKLARAGQKDVRKRIKRIEYQQQTGVIGWAMRELELLLTAPDVAAVIADCLELLMTEAEILERAVAQVFVRKLEPNADDLREQRQDIIDDFTEGLLTGREELAGVIGKLMLKEAWRILEANISLQRQKALLDGSGGGSSAKSKKKQQQQQQQQLDPPLTLPQAPSAPLVGGGDDQYSVADDDDLHDDDGDASKKRKKNKKKKNKKAKGKSAAAAAAAAAAAKSQTPSAPGHPNPSADVVSAAEDEDEDEDDEGTCVYADANDSQRDPQNPFDSLAWMSPSESSGAQPKQVPVAAARNGTEPAKKTVVAQPALQIQTQVQARAPPPPPPSSNDDEAVKAARSRRGTNAARYVPGVGFVSDDGVSATSPQLVASATSTAGGTLRGVQPGSVARAPAASGRMSPMSTVRMASPAPRSQSPLVMGSGPSTQPAGDRRALDKDALAKLQASLCLGPAEDIERALSGLAHDSLVTLASTAIIERRRTVDSAVEWNKAVDKVLSTYDLIAGQIGSLKTLCESHDSETERLETLLAQSTQEARKWQEQCVRLSAEVEALKAQKSGETEHQANGNLWSVGEQQQQQQQQQHVESNPWASSGYYGQTYPASNAFGHFAPGLVPPPPPPGGYMASASSYAAAVAAIQAQALAQQQQQQQQQMPSHLTQQGQQQSMPLSGSTDTSASSLLTALNARSQAF
ncbi:hypothetical protein GGH94_004708 [Coemansia aciculifera]|uniref:Uncharacterized protein n=1 Tax=Coemansia aciculifera TaxID=417176 RepID=A0A9W8IEX2_9FUNG|nr:hypothetical protein GGH94_004708 [Coemansia aciculifera]